MVKNIVFDMGGVLIDYDPYKTLRRTFSEEEAVLAEKVLFRSGMWDKIDLGDFRFPDLAKAACRELPPQMHAPLTAMLLRWWDVEMPPFKFMEDFVREVKDAGYKTYLCSNTSDEIYSHFDTIPALRLMDGIIASCDYGVAKPDARLFEALYTRFDLRPQECFFIDDMPRNIEGALKTGMVGHCFADKDVGRLRDALRTHGVKI
ncbi:MAG: HAD family phosphatase [Clostridia bacterium]|nr:HAD family phosphatase [Clostridia bacterium]